MKDSFRRKEFYWIHINITKQYLALVNGVDVEREYPVGRTRMETPYKGVFSIRRKVKNVQKYYTGEPTEMPEHRLTGSALELNFQVYDPRYKIYRPIAIHGCENHSIENEPSDGCILMNTKDIIELYPLVKLSTPVVITDRDVFRDVVPTKLLEFCVAHNIDKIEWERSE